jgi:biopolymer transport protein ExbB/TolQ
MKIIEDLLYLISNAFLFPTLLGTLIAFGYATYLLGQFLAELNERRTINLARRRFYETDPTPASFAQQKWSGYLARYADARTRFAHFPAMIDKEVADIDHEMHHRVERLGILSKVGPMLGLIGTLIPLQPALAGLARGDMQAMGANLQIGFTTTVVGLLVGGACYAISIFRREWYQQDITDIEFLQDIWREDSNASNPA